MAANEAANQLADKWFGVSGGMSDAAIMAEDIDAAIAEAVRQEREACELIALRERDSVQYIAAAWVNLNKVAAAIRNRKEKPDEQ